jgi:Zn-dependent protease with chaperone function
MKKILLVLIFISVYSYGYSIAEKEALRYVTEGYAQAFKIYIEKNPRVLDGILDYEHNVCEPIDTALMELNSQIVDVLIDYYKSHNREFVLKNKNQCNKDYIYRLPWAYKKSLNKMDYERVLGYLKYYFMYNDYEYQKIKEFYLSTLTLAVMYKNERLIDVILKQKVSQEELVRAFHMSLAIGDEMMADRFFDMIADKSAKDDQNNTLLAISAKFSNLKYLNKLCPQDSECVDINNQNLQGQTPLMMASKFYTTAQFHKIKKEDFYATIDFLHSRNADIKIKDKIGFSILGMLKSQRDFEVVEYLLKKYDIKEDINEIKKMYKQKAIPKEKAYEPLDKEAFETFYKFATLFFILAILYLYIISNIKVKAIEKIITNSYRFNFYEIQKKRKSLNKSLTNLFLISTLFALYFTGIAFTYIVDISIVWLYLFFLFIAIVVIPTSIVNKALNTTCREKPTCLPFIIIAVFVTGYVALFIRLEEVQLDSLETTAVLQIFAIMLLFVTIQITKHKQALQEKGNEYIAIDILKAHEAKGSDLPTRRAINVTQEMAVASGIKLPKLYIMDEKSINATSISYQGENAIVITQGACDNLSRDELQMLIATQFGHISTGNVKTQTDLNIWRISVNRAYGTNSSQDVDSLMIMVSSISVMMLIYKLVGFITNIFTLFIQKSFALSSIYHADALAVQYTRSSDTLVSLLAKTKEYGSKIKSVDVSDISYSFFATPTSTTPVHPPIADRIKVITKEPINDTKKSTNKETNKAKKANNVFSTESILATLSMVAIPSIQKIEYTKNLIETIPTELKDIIDDKNYTKKSIIALLLDSDEEYRQKGISLLDDSEQKDILNIYEMIKDTTQQQKIVILKLLLPNIKYCDTTLSDTIKSLIKLDNKMTQYEWLVEYIVLSKLNPKTTQTQNIENISSDISMLLSYISYLDTNSDEIAKDVFALSFAELGDMSLGYISYEELRYSKLSNAIDNIATLDESDRVKIIKTAIQIANNDGEISEYEASIIQVLSIALDIDIPIFS